VASAAQRTRCFGKPEGSGGRPSAPIRRKPPTLAPEAVAKTDRDESGSGMSADTRLKLGIALLVLGLVMPAGTLFVVGTDWPAGVIWRTSRTPSWGSGEGLRLSVASADAGCAGNEHGSLNESRLS
jgi:hypothetical protein